VTGNRSFSGRAAILASLAACLIIFSIPATSALAATAALGVSPTSGPAGTDVLVSGTGFAGDSIVTLGFVGATQTRAGTNAGGTFTDYLVAPAAAPGTYSISATDGINSASANFTVTASTVTTTGTTTSTTSTATSTTSSTTASSTSSKTTTATSKATSNATTTVTSTATSTETAISFFTITTAQPAVTLTATVNYTTTDTTTAAPAPPVTTTTTLTQPIAPVTVTVSVSQNSTAPASVQGAPQTSSGFSDTSIYFLAGVGILVTAIGVGMLAFRNNAIQDYRKNLPARAKET
jgi:hypothetical protein